MYSVYKTISTLQKVVNALAMITNCKSKILELGVYPYIHVLTAAVPSGLNWSG